MPQASLSHGERVGLKNPLLATHSLTNNAQVPMSSQMSLQCTHNACPLQCPHQCMPLQCLHNVLTMPLKMHLQCSHNASPNRQQHNPSYNALAMSLKCSYNALTMHLQCSHNASRNGQQHECSYNALVMLLQCTCKCLIMLHKIRQQTQPPLLQCTLAKCRHNVGFIKPLQNGQQTTQSLNYSLFTYYLLFVYLLLWLSILCTCVQNGQKW